MQVSEDYYISNDGGMTWILIGFKKLTPEEANQNGLFSIERRLLPPGDIQFRVVGNAIDAPGPIISRSTAILHPNCPKKESLSG